VGRWLTSAPPRRPSAAPTTVAASPDDTLAPTKAPCPGSVPAVPAGAVAVVGDLGGAGCTSAVVWWPDRGEAERPEPSGSRTHFVLGDPGDQLVLGDWNGDGLDTPGLYDPQRGEFVRFGGWADVGQVLTGEVDQTAVALNGLATVVRHTGGDDIEVSPAP